MYRHARRPLRRDRGANLTRGMSPGCAGIATPLCDDAKTPMPFGDARASLLNILAALKET